MTHLALSPSLCCNDFFKVETRHRIYSLCLYLMTCKIFYFCLTSDHIIQSPHRNIMSRLYEDIIQILSLKTNNQMQSYSPLALSLSYQSSLPEKTSSVFTYIYTGRGELQPELTHQDYSMCWKVWKTFLQFYFQFSPEQ